MAKPAEGQAARVISGESSRNANFYTLRAPGFVFCVRFNGPVRSSRRNMILTKNDLIPRRQG